jgi:mannose-6-phosphate isomerase-like protein (cupin superfamily)
MSRGLNERKNAAGIVLGDKLRKKALHDFRAHLKSWKLAMPPIEPLVLDFGLNDFSHFGLIEYWIANEIEAGYCGKFLFVFKGQTCPLHWHKKKHETFFIVRGKVEMCLGGNLSVMRAGDCLPVPPGKSHRFTGLEPSLLLEVSKPCIVKDNVFHDPHIPIGPNFKRHSEKRISRLKR